MQDDIVRKIQKCLRLAASANEHEAAAAMRQAQALMRKHGLSEAQVEAAGVCEARHKAGAKKKTPGWENMLVNMVARTFQCRSLFLCGRGQWTFIGYDTAPLVASHAYAQLYRQMQARRKAFIAGLDAGLTRGVKTRRADLYAQGWLASVREKLEAFTPSAEFQRVTDTFVAERYGATQAVIHRAQAYSAADAGAYYSGKADGASASLLHGVDGVAKPKQLA